MKMMAMASVTLWGGFRHTIPHTGPATKASPRPEAGDWAAGHLLLLLFFLLLGSLKPSLYYVFVQNNFVIMYLHFTLRHIQQPIIPD
jgi:hypothetical protein